MSANAWRSLSILLAVMTVVYAVLVWGIWRLM